MLLWQQRRWRTLLNLIDHLPMASHFYEAMSQNEDIARAWLARHGDERQESAPRLVDWNPVLAELVVMNERIGSLITATAAAGGQSIKIPPRPRPKTAIDRVRDQERMRKHDKLVRRLLPWQTDN